MSAHKTITAEELNAWIESKKPFTLIDVVPKEYFQEKHLPQAVNACIYETAFMENVKKEIPAQDDPIVVYSTSEKCMASTVAAERLISNGYSNIYEYQGGVVDWESKNFPMAGANPSQKETEQDLSFLTDKTYVVDSSKSLLQWSGANINSTHSGTLGISEGEIETKNKTIVGGHFVIDMNDMICTDIENETYNKMLIAHLKSDDFFSVDQFPQAKFSITQIDPIVGSTPGSNNITTRGELTVKGITKSIEFPAILSMNTDGFLVFLAQVDIDRTEWKVCYGSGKFFQKLGMHLVNDDLNIQFRLLCQ